MRTLQKLLLFCVLSLALTTPAYAIVYADYAAANTAAQSWCSATTSSGQYVNCSVNGTAYSADIGKLVATVESSPDCTLNCLGDNMNFLYYYGADNPCAADAGTTQVLNASSSTVCLPNGLTNCQYSTTESTGCVSLKIGDAGWSSSYCAPRTYTADGVECGAPTPDVSTQPAEGVTAPDGTTCSMVGNTLTCSDTGGTTYECSKDANGVTTCTSSDPSKEPNLQCTDDGTSCALSTPDGNIATVTSGDTPLDLTSTGASSGDTTGSTGDTTGTGDDGICRCEPPCPTNYACVGSNNCQAGSGTQYYCSAASGYTSGTGSTSTTTTSTSTDGTGNTTVNVDVDMSGVEGKLAGLQSSVDGLVDSLTKGYRGGLNTPTLPGTESAQTEYAQAQAEFQSLLGNISQEASSYVSVSSSTGQLPCWTFPYNGQTIRICPRDYETELSILAYVVMLMAAMASAYILLR